MPVPLIMILTRALTDDVIIQEAVRLVRDGVSVTFPVKGHG